MEVKNKNKKNLKCEILQITVEKQQYSKHIMELHESKFAEYKQLIPEARKFFASRDTAFQPMNASNVSLNVLVKKAIVKTIISNLLIVPDSDEDDLNNLGNPAMLFGMCHKIH